MAYLGNGRWGLKRLPVTPPPKGTPRLKKITYKPEWDEPVKKKPTRRKKKSTRKSSTRRATTTRQVAARPKKRLPKMKTRGW